MIKNIIIALFFLCLNSHAIFSQTIIAGKIQNRQQEALADVSVMLMHADSTILDYTLSDEKGTYKLNYSGKESHLLLSVSAFEISPQIKHIDNRSQTVDFIVEQKALELKEVVVLSNKIWSQKDTINYLVSAFSDKKDIVIGDVLKKMPGINVAESGQISYNGKPINKFYIENLDMLGGRYGIATNNVTAKDISTVQILENHQPIKALENINISDEAAINLKIKEGRKGVFSIIALLGLGGDTDGVLWQGELTGMYFEKKRQQIFTYKTNNNGININKEIQSFTGNSFIGELQMTSVQQPSPPSIRFERYNFNNTHAVTANNLYVLKNDAKLKANLLFYHNEDKRHGFSRTSYFIPGEEEQTIVEDISTRSTNNNLEAEFDYELNKNNVFLNNNLRASGNWDDNRGDVLTAKHVRQYLDNKSFSITNNTRWVKRAKNEKGIEISSKIAFRTQPHHLNVFPGLYPDLFNEGEEYTSLKQNVHSNTLLSNNSISFLSAISLGKLRINPTGIFSVEHRTLRSDFDLTNKQLITQPVTAIDMSNDIQFTRINSGLSLGLVYAIENVKIKLSLPVIYRYTDLNNQLIDKNSLNQGKLYFQPTFMARYQPNEKIEITLNGAHSSSIPELNTLYTGYILQNYRKINRYNDTDLFDSRSISGSFGTSYRDVLSMFFAKGEISYSHYSSDGIYGQTIDNMLTITEFLEKPNKGNSLSISGRTSKGFNWNELIISLDGSWGQNKSDLLRQKEFVQYTSQWLRANLKINLRPLSWFTIEYKGEWDRSKAKVSTGERFKAIKSLTQEMSAYISLPFDMSLNSSWEHYYNSAAETNKNFSLLDISLGYTKNKIQYSLNWANILNTSKYVSASYGALNSYYSEYDIRPMTVMLNVRLKLY